MFESEYNGTHVSKTTDKGIGNNNTATNGIIGLLNNACSNGYVLHGTPHDYNYETNKKIISPPPNHKILANTDPLRTIYYALFNTTTTTFKILQNKTQAAAIIELKDTPNTTGNSIRQQGFIYILSKEDFKKETQLYVAKSNILHSEAKISITYEDVKEYIKILNNMYKSNTC
ncbi:MAG: hypothetical protein ACP5NV_06885 [Candidatus Woesearchaeota archaeon]